MEITTRIEPVTCETCGRISSTELDREFHAMAHNEALAIAYQLGFEGGN
jgi:hypothetical protein